LIGFVINCLAGFPLAKNNESLNSLKLFSSFDDNFTGSRGSALQIKPRLCDAMMIKIGFRPAGFFPSRVAEYSLGPSANGRINVCQSYRYPDPNARLAVGESASLVNGPKDYQSVRLSMSMLWQAMTGGAVNAHPNLAPEAIAAPLAAFSQVIFCSTIIRQDQSGISWLPGLTLGQFRLSPAEQRNFLSQARYLSDPEKTIFLSCASAGRELLDATALQQNIQAIIGQKPLI